MKTTTLTVFTLLLTGCAHHHYYYYAPPSGYGAAQVARDQADCRAQGTQAAVPYSHVQRGKVRRSTHGLCLEGKGWTVEQI